MPLALRLESYYYFKLSYEDGLHKGINKVN